MDEGLSGQLSGDVPGPRAPPGPNAGCPLLPEPVDRLVKAGGEVGALVVVGGVVVVGALTGAGVYVGAVL